MRDRNAPLTLADADALAWEKMGGLLPAVVQDGRSGRVLMLGYMNRDALEHSLRDGRVTFFSRSKDRLWQKGEISGNHLLLRSIHADCDDDALLVLADPQGPTCHTGSASCFGDVALDGTAWLAELASIVSARAEDGDSNSYTRHLLDEGTARIAQKVGEEGVEVALAAVSRTPAECAEEMADLLYHLTVLMQSLGLSWDEVVNVLKSRHAESSATASS
jgi:phosphoribosyl-ATP pyrophosphohydrolase/phosphoribosyl-AMP cyclohydrolase